MPLLRFVDTNRGSVRMQRWAVSWEVSAWIGTIGVAILAVTLWLETRDRKQVERERDAYRETAEMYRRTDRDQELDHIADRIMHSPIVEAVGMTHKPGSNEVQIDLLLTPTKEEQ